jgi:uncharacterized protein YidB (DUF937 family)
MGILDQVLGNVLGSGQQQPGQTNAMSPMVKTVLMLLAAKAYQSYTNRQPGPDQVPGSMPDQGAGGMAGGGTAGGVGGSGGGLGGMLGGLLGGLGGGALGGGGGLGGALGGGGSGGGLGGLLAGLGGAGALGSLVDQFRQKGYGDHVDSWVGNGPNQPIAPDQVADALGPDTIDQLSQQFKMPRGQMLSELSNELPGALDHATPQGRLPNDDEFGRRV